MKMSEYLSENFQFLEVKFSIYLNRRVCVMLSNNRRILLFSIFRSLLYSQILLVFHLVCNTK